VDLTARYRGCNDPATVPTLNADTNHLVHRKYLPIVSHPW